MPRTPATLRARAIGEVRDWSYANGREAHDIIALYLDPVGRGRAPALQLVKSSDSGSYINPGDQLDYTYTLTNTGNVTLGGPFTIQGRWSPDGTE